MIVLAVSVASAFLCGGFFGNRVGNCEQVLTGAKLWLLWPPDTPDEVARAWDVMAEGDDNEAISHMLELVPRQLARQSGSSEQCGPVFCIQEATDTVFVPPR